MSILFFSYAKPLDMDNLAYPRLLPTGLRSYSYNLCFLQPLFVST